MKSHDEVADLIHDVLPRLPGEALELLEHLGVIGEHAELAQELAQTLGALRAAAPAAPVLGADLADRVLAALPDGFDAVAYESDRAASAPRAELLAFPAPAPVRGPALLLAASLLFSLGALLGAQLGAQPPRRGPTPAHVAAAQPAPTVAPPAPSPAASPEPADGRAGAVEVVEPGLAGGPVTGPAATRPAAWPQGTRDPVQAYVAEASYVLEALERLDADDPRVARVLAVHLHQTALLEQGERLLVAMRYSPEQRGLRPLIQGTQLVLRKVQHAPRAEAAPLQAIRQEVRRTGLLDACRQVVAASASPEPEPAPAPGAGRDL